MHRPPHARSSTLSRPTGTLRIITPAASPARPLCPSCRYDLSGEPPRWSGFSPIRGQCPECGTDFLWGDAFRTTPAHRIPWLHDLTPGRRPGIRRAYRTALHALFPWSFWRRITPATPASPARLALWLVLILLPAYLTFLAINAWHEYLSHEWILPPDPFIAEFFAPFAYDAGETTPSGTIAPLWFPDRAALGRALGAVTPALMLLLLPTTRAAAGIRPIHLARIATYAQLPLLSPVFWHIVSLLVAIDGNFGFLGRLGFSYSRGFYHWWGLVARWEGHALTAWLALWWYFAVSRGLRLPRPLATTAAAVAILPVVIATLGYWRYWAALWHAF